MFLHLSVSHSVHRGWLPLGPGGVHPVDRRPQADTPRADTHPPLRRPQQRMVRILLECNLVQNASNSLDVIRMSGVYYADNQILKTF